MLRPWRTPRPARRRPAATGCRRASARESAPRSPALRAPQRVVLGVGDRRRVLLVVERGRAAAISCGEPPSSAAASLGASGASTGDRARPLLHRPLPIRLGGGGARLVGDLGAGQHAGDLLAALAPSSSARDVGARRGRPRSHALADRQCRSARAATCGAWVTTSTCRARPAAPAARRPRRPSRRRRRRRPRRRSASAREPRSASTTFSASMKRDSSPPEAILAIGPGRGPGLVATSKPTRSQPSGPPAVGVQRLDLDDEPRPLELQRRQLGLTGGVSRRPPPGACADRSAAAAR